MGYEYRTVEGEVGAVNTLTALTSFGAETTGPIQVPVGKTKIIEIWSATSLQVDTDTDRVGCVLRLSGKGLPQGEQDFPLYSGYAEGTGAQAVGHPVKILPVDLDCVSPESITVEVAAVGDDVARGHVEIGLTFA